MKKVAIDLETKKKETNIKSIQNNITNDTNDNKVHSINNVYINEPALPVDIIATYVNTTDNINVKTDLLRTHSRLSQKQITRAHTISRSGHGSEATQEWGWFVDIDSSGESLGGISIPNHNSTNILNDINRRKISPRHSSSKHILCDESKNTQVTAALKTFPEYNVNHINQSNNTNNTNTPSSSKNSNNTYNHAIISIPKFRIVQSKSGTDRHAEYLVTFKLRKDFYVNWRRYSEFFDTYKKVSLLPEQYVKTLIAWKNIDSRWFNRLEPSYLHEKCIALEKFLRELMYESIDPSLFIDFLGGYSVNTKPTTDSMDHRPPAQIPKELRPAQPKEERELFEKLWEENFKRSSVDYNNTSSTSIS